MSHNIGIEDNQQYDQSARNCYANISQAARNLGMPVTEHLSKQALAALNAKNARRPLPVDSPFVLIYLRTLAELLHSIHTEAKSKVALILNPDQERLFSQLKPIFGDEVARKLPKAATDISEAGKCLALELPTACVFHLMRVAEYAVQRLGKRLRVKIDVESETWYQIIIHINKAVDSLPGKTVAQRRSKQRYGAIAAHLNAVRIATRNDVMHPKAVYTMKEAQEVFDATRSLIQQVTEVI